MCCKQKSDAKHNRYQTRKINANEQKSCMNCFLHCMSSKPAGGTHSKETHRWSEDSWKFRVESTLKSHIGALCHPFPLLLEITISQSLCVSPLSCSANSTAAGLECFCCRDWSLQHFQIRNRFVHWQKTTYLTLCWPPAAPNDNKLYFYTCWQTYKNRNNLEGRAHTWYPCPLWFSEPDCLLCSFFSKDGGQGTQYIAAWKPHHFSI